MKQAAVLERPTWQGIECNLWPLVREKCSPKLIPLWETESCWRKHLVSLEALRHDSSSSQQHAFHLETPGSMPGFRTDRNWEFKPLSFGEFCYATIQAHYLSLFSSSNTLLLVSLFPISLFVGLYVFLFLYSYFVRISGRKAYAFVEPSIFYWKSLSNRLLQTEYL